MKGIYQMIVLTIYTDKFDSTQNVCNGGMSGKVFLEEANGKGEEDKPGFEFDDIDAALEYCERNRIDVGRIDFHYLDDMEVQKFWKFNVQG